MDQAVQAVQTDQAQTDQMDQMVQALWDRYMLERSFELKNELLLHYLPLVKTTVLRMLPSYFIYNESEDLISCGVFGLMAAIERYDPSRDVKFETYASKRIRGSVLDYMRKQDWAPNSYRRKVTKISNAYRALETKLMRTPTEQEVADQIGLPLSDLQNVLEKTHTFNILYFEDVVYDSGAAEEAALMDTSSPSDRLEREELTAAISRLLDMLPEKERMIVSLYYYEELTLREIAEVLNLSESRISQINSKALIWLKTKLSREFPR